MDINPERLVVVCSIHSHRVATTVADLHPVSGEQVIAHKAVECPWAELSEKSRKEAISESVRLAADSAGIEVHSLFLSRSDTSFHSRLEQGWLELGEEVTIDATTREWALRKAREKGTAADSEVIDALPVAWTVRTNAGDREVEDPVGEKGRGLTCQALVVTARRGYRAELAGLARSLGWELDGVIAQPVALYRGMANSLPKSGSTLVFDLGGRHTTVLIRVKQQLNHLETFEFGGDDLTRRIADSLDLSYEAAEALKLQVDIASISETNQAAGQQVIWTDLQEADVRRHKAARICAEGMRSFLADRARDLRESGHLGQRGHVYLVGRAAGMAGMVPVAKDIFDLPVALGTGDRHRNPGDEMDNLLITGQVRVAAALRREQILIHGTSIASKAGGVWNWLTKRFD